MEKVRKIPQDDVIDIIEGPANNIRFRKAAEGIPENKQERIYGHKLLTRFNNYLDERHGTVNIACYSFRPSDILKTFNPAAYRVQSKRFMRNEGWHKV